jgi:transposase-like protein
MRFMQVEKIRIRCPYCKNRNKIFRSKENNKYAEFYCEKCHRKWWLS